MDIKDPRKALINALYKDEMKKISELFALCLNIDSKLCLEPQLQLKLARALAEKNNCDLAVKAYQNLILIAPHASLTADAMFEAGKMCFERPNMLKESIWFLKNYLRTNPSGKNFHDAVEMFKELQKKLNHEIQNIESAVSTVDRVPNDTPNLKPASSKEHSSPLKLDINNQFNIHVANHEQKQPNILPQNPINKEVNLNRVADKNDKDVFRKMKLSDTSSVPLVSENKFGILIQSDTSEILASVAKTPKKESQNKEGINNAEIPAAIHPAPTIPQPQPTAKPAAPKIEEIKHTAEKPTVPENLPPKYSEKSKPISSPSSKPEQHSHKPTERPITEKSSVHTQDEENNPTLSHIEMPQKDKDEQQDSEKLAEKKLRWENATYTIIFEPGQQINPDMTTQTLAEILNTDPYLIKKQIFHGKGIITRKTEFKKAFEILSKFHKKGQKILSIREDKSLIYETPVEIEQCSFFESWFNCIAEDEIYKILSSEIFVIVLGSLLVDAESNTHKNVMDMFIHHPHVRLRIWENTFNFKSSGLSYEASKNNNIQYLIKRLTAVAPHAVLCPNTKSLLKNPDRPLRHFHSLSEFENYAEWLLLAYFGKDLGKKLHLFA